MARVEAIARSVVRVIVKGVRKRSRSPIAFILALLSTIFSFYELPLHKHRAEVFGDLREKHWKVQEDDYVASFRADEGGPPESALTTLGDLALSGSVRVEPPCTRWRRGVVLRILCRHFSRPRTRSSS